MINLLIPSLLSAQESPEPAPDVVADEPAADSGPVDMDMLMSLAETYGVEGIKVLVIMVIAWFIAGWAGGWLSRVLGKARVEQTLSLFFGKLLRWGILVLAILACLQRFGVNTTSFAAVIAAAGFAVGLAFQGTLSNFSSGVMLLIFRPFKVNDYVEIGGESGTVREIDLFTTEIDTLDNRHIVIPNSKIFGEVIENYTCNPERRVDVDVGVAYNEDLDQTRAVLTAAAAKIANRLEDRDPEIVLVGLGASSVDWQVRVWTKPVHYWQVREDALVGSKKALDEAGLSIPFPQMDVHFDSSVALNTD